MTGEVTHGAEQQGYLLFVVFDVGGFVADFGHDQAVDLRVEDAKTSEVMSQLITENQPEAHKLYISTFKGITNV